MASANSHFNRNASLGALLTRSLDARWVQYLSVLQKARRDPSEKPIHDLRVATRRLISTIDLLTTVVPGGKLRRIRARLRAGLKAFNPLRDVQVQVLAVEQMVPLHPVLEPFHTVLLIRERRLVKGIGRHIARFPGTEIEKDLQEIRQQVEASLQPPGMSGIVVAAVVGAAGAAFAKAVGLRLRVDAKNTATIHKLRVAFKKLRYTLESLQPVLGDITDQQLKAMNAHQQLMGDIQDAEVLRAAFSAYALHRGKLRNEPLRAVQRTLLDRRNECVRLYLQSADTLFTFWQDDFTAGPILERPRAGMKV